IVGSYNGVTNPSFSYDDNGNMTGGAGRSMTYTVGNMTTILAGGGTPAEFVYAPEHQRYKMCAPTCALATSSTVYLNDPMTGGVSEKVVVSGATSWRDYIVVPGSGLVAERFKTGSTVTWLYPVTDHLGSGASFVDPSRSPPALERDSYDAWGRRRNADGSDNPTCSNTSQTTKGFTSQEQIDNQCLVNMNARI